MVSINTKETFTFSDILLQPSYSTIESRSNVDVSVKLCKGFSFETPIIAANMKTIVGEEMAKLLLKRKALTILHRFHSSENEYIELFNKLFSKDNSKYLGVSLGIKDEDKKLAVKFFGLGCNIFCIDIAHAHSKMGEEMTKFVASNFPDALLIVGNIATHQAAQDLWSCGADVVKVGIGGGSICSTRLTAGAGVPQLSAVMDVVDNSKKQMPKQKFVISDGGMREYADLTKALAWADMVMIGSMLASCQESPGEIIKKDGKLYKRYSGSSTYKMKFVEGVKAMKEIQGNAGDIIDRMHEALQSGCSYAGASNLEELKQKAIFNKISVSALHETKIHDVIETK